MTFTTNDYKIFSSKYSSAICSFGNSMYDTEMDKLKNKEALKKEGIFEEVLLDMKKTLVMNTMYDVTRFFELTFIKKFFLKQLLLDISKNNISSISHYFRLKNDMEFLSIKFDEEQLFTYPCSQRDLYVSIVKKTGLDELQEKVSKMLSNLKDNLQLQRELDLKKTESLLIMLTTFLTIIVSFTGINVLVEKVFVNLPRLGINISIIENHPLRVSVSLWIVILCFLSPIIVKRYVALNK